MWLYRFKRLMAEREVLVGLVIFGLSAMLADFLTDLGMSRWPAVLRGFGLVLLMSLLIWEFWLRPRFRQRFPVPLMFTEETDRTQARSQFERFVKSADLSSALKVLQGISALQREDLIIRLDRANPRNSPDAVVWKRAWSELLLEWEREVDKRLGSELIANDGKCYHIFPHVVLPLAFALGASVGLRRPTIVYHQEGERYYQVLDLSRPRSIFDPPDSSVPLAESIPEDLSARRKHEKLILHVVISEIHRHPVQLDKHPDHTAADNAALIYGMALNPESDWLPYLQSLVQKANRLAMQYQQVDVCLICPAAVAFALGMAFSRIRHVTVCHWLGGQYLPVFPLETIEERLPFD
ncbi:MAG: hypothetical protein L0Y67_00100 [Gammaproteobacteria bacterium]|nr:hypothetical protein [Gammaproteobacteria bacterium]